MARSIELEIGDECIDGAGIPRKIICSRKYITEYKVAHGHLTKISEQFEKYLTAQIDQDSIIYDSVDGDVGVLRDVSTEHFLECIKSLLRETPKENLHSISLMLVLSWFTTHFSHICDWHLINSAIQHFIKNAKVIIPTDWLWCIQEYGLISTHTFFNIATCNEEKIANLLQGLIEIWALRSSHQSEVKIVGNTILLWLVSSAFLPQQFKTSGNLNDIIMPTKFRKDNAVTAIENEYQQIDEAVSQQVLSNFFCFYVDQLQNSSHTSLEQNYASEILQVINASKLPLQTITRFLSFAFKTTVLQTNKSTIAYALEHQKGSMIKKWRCEKSLAEFMMELLVPFSASDVSTLMMDIANCIIQASVNANCDDDYLEFSCKLTHNWTMFNLFISVFISCFQDSVNVVKDIVDRLIINSLDTDQQGKIPFEIAMIIVRQACLESAPGSLQTYGLWFSQTFGNESTTLLGKSKKRLVNFVKYLTNMVPYETQGCLRTHISRPPWIPLESRQIWMEYCALLRTRLSDLNTHTNPEWMSNDQPIFNTIIQKYTASNQDSGKRGFVENSATLFETPVVEDVEKALELFKTNRKIPQIVLEASIFRRPFFIGQFLPSLLALTLKAKAETDKSNNIQLIKDFVISLKCKVKMPTQLLVEFEKYI